MTIAANIRVTITQRNRPTVDSTRTSGDVVVVILRASSRAPAGPGGDRKTADLAQFAEGDAGRLSGLYVVDAAGGAGGHVLSLLQGIAALGHQAQQDGEGGGRAARDRGRRAGPHMGLVDEHLA